MRKQCFVLSLLAFVLVLGCEETGGGNDTGNDSNVGSDDVEVVEGQDLAIGTDVIAGDKLGACVLQNNVPEITACMIYCGETGIMLDAQKQGCEANGYWVDEPVCPAGSLGVCRVDAIMCEQYCYQDADLTVAESLENCIEICGGTFETF